MKIILYIYIFALYILCIPGFLFKTKLSEMNKLLFSLLFTLILYFSLNFIDQNIENYEEKTSVTMSGINNLVNLVDNYNKEKETNIDIQNEIKGTENSGAECWNALGKTQKDLEVLKIQLNSYDGTWDALSNLDKEIITYKEKVASLQETLDGYKGSKNSMEKLTIQLNNYKDQLAALQKQLLAFGDSTSSSLENLNSELNKLEGKEETLITDKGKCTSKTPLLTKKVNDAQSEYNKNNGTITKLRSTIANKELCNLKVTMTQHCPFRGWQEKHGIGNYSTVRAGGISSLDVPEGLKLEIFGEENFGGGRQRAIIRGPRNIRCLTSFSDNAYFGNNGSITNWNDKIKSFKITYDESWDGA